MSGRPAIDVIVTHYNLQDTVVAAVDSALDQDDVDTRVVLVDDASDAAMPIGDWPQDRVTVVHRSVRGGLAASLNSGLAVANAPLVSFLDADDLWPSYRSALLAGSLATTGADIAFGAQLVFADGDVPQLRLSDAQRRNLGSAPVGLITGTCLMRRELFDAGGFPEDSSTAFLAWASHMRMSPNPPSEVSVNEVVLLRRSHARNMTRQSVAEVNRGYFEAIAQARRQR